MYNKNFLLVLVLLLVAPALLAQDKVMPKHAYVGVKTCTMCHKTEKQGEQLKIWENSKHSKAYETLKTDEANKIAKEKGFDTPAVETEACLKCHAPAHNVDASMLEKNYKVEQGVQCETCHGPGADYKSIKIMRNKDEAVKNGLVMHEDLDTFCATCHNSESPTHKGDYDFKAMWKEIEHKVPQK